MANFRTETKKDTATPLFTQLFMCKYSPIYAMDEDELKHYGVYSTGDKSLDKDILGYQQTIGMLTIDRIIELYKVDCPISICKREDTIKIYELIQDHLYAWLERLEYGVNIYNAPIEDLIVLDEFAQKIFQYVGPEYKAREIKNDIHARLTRYGKYNVLNIVKKPLSLQSDNVKVDEEDGSVEINTPKDDTPKRESLADMLKQSLMNLRK